MGKWMIIDEPLHMINTDHLQTNQEKINIIKAQKHFSKSFNILLIPKLADTDSSMIDAGKTQNGDDTSKRLKLQQYLNAVIQSETEATEERIDLYAKQQRAALSAFCLKAEQDYHEILG